jgi:hypothetical protein
MNVGIGKTSARMLSCDALKVDEITFSIGESDIGLMLVARSEIGIRAILIASSVDELRSDLSMRFPESLVIQNDERLRGDRVKVAEFIANPQQGLDLSLDIRGTPFQRRVWDSKGRSGHHLCGPCASHWHAECRPCGRERLRE